MHSLKELRSRPIWGIAIGLAMGFVLLLFTGVRAGSMRFPIAISAMHLLGGAGGGLIFGLGLPFARSRVGAAFLGVLVSAPFFALYGFIEARHAGDDALHWSSLIFSAVVVGGLSGYLIRHALFPELDGIDQADDVGKRA